MNAQLVQETMEFIRDTGRYIQEASTTFKAEDIEEKGLNDLVSYVDKQAEIRLVEGCRRVFPEAGFLTEEGTTSDKGERYTWIIDPLDGTTNFIHGLPIYAISVALMDRENLVMGIVYELNKNEMFHAVRNEGAFCNGTPIHVSNVRQLQDGLLATGFPYYEFSNMNKYVGILQHFMQHTHGLRRMGSAAVDLAYTACGRFEGFFEYNLKPWDVAAGILLVEEAGGKVTDFSGGGDSIFGKELVAGAVPIQDEMQKIIADFWFDQN